MVLSHPLVSPAQVSSSFRTPDDFCDVTVVTGTPERSGLSGLTWEKNRRNEMHYHARKERKIAIQNSETPPRISGKPQQFHVTKGRHQPTSVVVGRKEKEKGRTLGLECWGKGEVRMGL